MYPTNQLNEIAWPVSYPTLVHPDSNTDVLPVADVDLRGQPTPYILTLYDSQHISYGTRLQVQYEGAERHAPQEYNAALCAADVHYGTALCPHEADAAPMEDAATSSTQETNVRNYRSSHLRHQTQVDFQKEILRYRVTGENKDDNYMMDLMYPSPQGSPARALGENTVQWGSDPTFESETASTQRRVRVKHMTQFQLQLMPHNEDEEGVEKREGEGQGEEQEEKDSGGDEVRIKRKKTQADNTKSGTPSSFTSNLELKGLRKKLTIEQKRCNHIRHEKKRRGLIRDRFNDLTELVPELRGGTWSRSKILLKAMERILSLTEMNEELQDELDTLKASERHSMRYEA